MKKHSWLVVVVLLVALVLMAAGCGQKPSGNTEGEGEAKGTDFPAKEIRIICPYSPGGGFDVQARGIAPFIEKHLPNNVPVLVENMDGAGGLLAAHSVWNSSPDGYTILQAQVSTFMVEQYLNPGEVSFKMDEFRWVGQYQKDIRAFAVRPDMSIESWDDLVEYANSKGLLVGTAGLGSPPFKEAQLIAQLSGLKFDYVHYPGSSDVQAGFARKEVDAINLNFNSLMQWEAEGDAKILFIWDDQRHEMIPDVPTALEFGVPEDLYNEIMSLPVIGTPRAFAAPPGTPDEVLEVLRKAFMDAMNDPEYKAWTKSAKQIYGPIVPGDEFDKVIGTMDRAISENLELIKSLEQ